jgi:hypothetical protein
LLHLASCILQLRRIPEHLPQNYDEEVAEYTGRAATHQFYISSKKIKCDDVKSWWHVTRDSGGYHFVGRNCCDVVYDALKEGGCRRHTLFSLRKYKTGVWLLCQYIPRPPRRNFVVNVL